MILALFEPISWRRLVWAAALLVVGPLLHAEELCSRLNADGVVTCQAGLEHGRIEEIVAVQEGPSWCWAASISMIFRHYGYKLPQSQLVVAGASRVSSTLPASGEMISWLLSRRWVAQGGKEFESVVSASDNYANRYEITNEEVIAELSRGHPLLLGAHGHAMVLVAMQFQRSARGALRIVGGIVIDPTPGVGIRNLTASEMRPTYVAAIRIRKESLPAWASSGAAVDDDGSSAAAAAAVKPATGHDGSTT